MNFDTSNKVLIELLGYCRPSNNQPLPLTSSIFVNLNNFVLLSAKIKEGKATYDLALLSTAVYSTDNGFNEFCSKGPKRLVVAFSSDSRFLSAL